MSIKRDLSESFRARFVRAYELSRHDSYSQLSLAASLSRPMAHRIATGRYDDSSGGPRIFNVKSLADQMDVSVGYLLGEHVAPNIEAQAPLNQSEYPRGIMERLLETHARGAGRLEAFENLIDDCDIYAVPAPDDKNPTIIRVGRHTLFAKRLGGPIQADAQKELKAMTPEKRDDILAFHRKVAAETMAVQNSYLDHIMVTRAAHVRALNTRLGLLVKDADHQPFILLHAMPVPV